ncbi:MAG: MORN repeat-containing protein [Rhodoferax sp.]
MTTAKDIRSSCLVSDIASLEQLSVTWTGDCVAGKATGVGNLLAFGEGKLRYIVRGQFTEGRLTRQDQMRDCSGDRCNDEVAPGLLREHADLYQLRQARPAVPAAAAVVPVPAAAAVVPVPVPVPAAAVVPVPAALSMPGPKVNVEIRAEDAIYKGNFVLDKNALQISGDGRVEFFDGRLFEGRLELGRKIGLGTYVWANGQRYTGNWRDDQPDGEGEWTSATGDRYIGSFVAGKRVGKGRMVYADKTEYNGSWANDRPSGPGVFKFLNGDVYEGQFEAGEQSGTGTLTHRNGDSYTGSWLQGKRNGKGVAQWKDGQRYEGDWRVDRKEGQGLMQFPDGGSYEGAWVNDQATGLGSIKFASGDSYTGAVRNGVPQGKGVYLWGSGDKFEGDFDAGRPTASGVMTFHIPPPAEAAAAAETPASAPVAAATPAAAAPVSKATLCSRAYNAARSAAALKKFMDAFPEDECGRHALARQKIAAFEENERKIAREQADRQEQAKALIGLMVAYHQDYSHCVAVSGGNCQNVVYEFEVKGKILEINVARQSVKLGVTSVTQLPNDRDAPAKLFADGKAAALDAFRKRMVGSTQSKSKTEVGLQF